VEDIEFWIFFVIRNSTKLQRLVLEEGQINCVSSMFTLEPMVEGTLVINPSDDGYIGIGLADDYIRSYIISSYQNKFQLKNCFE
jgi:hypothetical protein